MAGIEFLEPTGASDPPGAPSTADTREPAPLAAPPPVAIVWMSWLAAGLWSAAAVLALAAAYRPVLQVSYAGGPGSYTVDAWGHYSGGGAAEAVLRGARYGPVLCGSAAVFAALAVCCALAALGRPSGLVQFATGAVSILAAGFLAGLTAAMVLQITSKLDSERASVHRVAGLGDPVNGAVQTMIGRSVVFIAVSLGCAVIAAAAGHPAVQRLVPSRRPSETRPGVPPRLPG